MNQEPIQKRGVQNPRIVDLIRYDENLKEVILQMVELRPWGVDGQHQQIGNKFDAYLSFILDGYLSQHYPQYKDKLARIELLCAEPHREADEEFLHAVVDFADDHEIPFTIRVLSEEEKKFWKNELENPNFLVN